MEKLKRTAKVLDNFVRVFRWLFVAAGAIAVVALAVFLGLYLSAERTNTAVLMSTGGMMLDLGDVTLELAKSLSYNGSMLPTMAALTALAAVGMALSFLAACILHRILAPMAEGQPFDVSVSKNLRQLGWLSLAWVVFAQLLKFMIALLKMKMVNLTRFFDPNVVSGYRVNLTLELGDLIVPVLIFLLSWIFRYGEELQRQSDETL